MFEARHVTRYRQLQCVQADVNQQVNPYCQYGYGRVLLAQFRCIGTGHSTMPDHCYTALRQERASL
jgi:hypothetical protein